MKRRIVNVKTIFVAAALATLLFLPGIASAQPYIIIDEVEVATSYVYHSTYGYLNRYDNYTSVGTATVNNGGWLNSQSSTIITATVNGGGLFDNDDGSRINTATVNGGTLNNWSGGKWDDDKQETVFYIGTIDTATVNDGTLNSAGGWVTYDYDKQEFVVYGGRIGTATVNGGALYNDYYSTITTVTVNGGTLYNNGRIGTVTVNGGTVNNSITVNRGGRIEEMTYVSGTYNAMLNLWPATIGTLTLAGDSTLNTGDWGDIENLVFDKNGNGVATLTAFADENNFGFSGIKADYVDFTYGKISLDLTAFGGISELYDGFYLSTLFGATDFSGVEYLSSLGVTWGDDSFWILNNGKFGAGWSIDFGTGFVSYSDVPEPATLLMLGVAAAGIPVVRWLRRG